MADIYENGLVTLSATKAPDAMGGCCSTCDPRHKSKMVELTMERRSDVFLHHFRDVLPHGDQKDTLNLPLLSRAW